MKQDRRFKKTQKAIYKAFSALLLEKDFTKITINDISNLADINRSTFYLHFEDKYTLLDAYLLDLLPIIQFADNDRILTNQDLLEQSLGYLYDYLKENFLFFKRLFNEQNSPFAVQSVKKALRRFFDQHASFFPEQLGNSKEFTVHIRVSGIIAMIEWFLLQEDYSREQFIRETRDLVNLLDKV